MAPSVRGFNINSKTIFVPQEINKYAKIVLEPVEITLNGKSSITVSVTIAKPPSLILAKNWVYSGFINIQPVTIKTQPTITVPYMGLKGSIKNVVKYLAKHITAKFG